MSNPTEMEKELATALRGMLCNTHMDEEWHARREAARATLKRYSRYENQWTSEDAARAARWRDNVPTGPLLSFYWGV